MDGRVVKEKITEAKNYISKFFNIDIDDFIFTSCASEANNTILKSMLFWPEDRKHLIISKIEHPSILETAKCLEKNGIKVSYIGVDSNGIIDLNEFEKI